jgi:hypothetical protein
MKKESVYIGYIKYIINIDSSLTTINYRER